MAIWKRSGNRPWHKSCQTASTSNSVRKVLDAAHFFRCQGKIKNPQSLMASRIFRWSEWRDSNSRPHGPEPCALPTALHPDMKLYGSRREQSYYMSFPPFCQEGNPHFSKSPAAHGREALAGACENRTHPRGSSPLSPVLKTGGHTSTHLLPCERQYNMVCPAKQEQNITLSPHSDTAEFSS